VGRVGIGYYDPSQVLAIKTFLHPKKGDRLSEEVKVLPTGTFLSAVFTKRPRYWQLEVFSYPLIQQGEVGFLERLRCCYYNHYIFRPLRQSETVV